MMTDTDRLSINRQTTVNGYCLGCLYRKCQTQTEIEDGVAMRVNGHPDSPINLGTLCTRGQAQLHNLYNPYRTKKPLIRTNPKKGLFEDPGWEEISWEEAMSIVTQKIKAAVGHDPRKFVYLGGFGASMSLFHFAFPIALDSPNVLSTPGSFCSVHSVNQITRGAFLEAHDPKYSNFVITCGRGSLSTGHSDGETRMDTEAINDRGMRLIKVDPRNPFFFRNSDWIPIRPLSDLAFFLSMINIILHEIQIFDEHFVKNHTNGVFLIDPDGNYIYGPDGTKPLVWDKYDGMAKPFNDINIVDYALEGDYDIEGVKCKPAFELIKKKVKQYTPEWAQEYTDISPKRVRKLTEDLVREARIGSSIEINGVTLPYRPACISFFKGLSNHSNGHVAAFAAMSINILLGAWDVPGGSQACNNLQYDCDEEGTPTEFHLAPPPPFSYPPNRMDLHEFLPMGHDLGYNFVNAMNNLDKFGFDYKPEVILNYGCNLFSKGASEEEVERALAAIPFMVSISTHFDEHTNFADIVLPEASNSEVSSAYGINFDRPGIKDMNRSDGACQALVKPMYDGRHADDVYMELADRLGILSKMQGIFAKKNKIEELDPDKKYTVEEIYGMRIRAAHGKEWNFDKLAQKGSMTIPKIPEELSYAYTYLKKTGARIPLYNMPLKRYGEKQLEGCRKAGIEHPAGNERVKEFYQPIPHWFLTPDMPWGENAKKDFDLNVVGWRSSLFLHDIHDQTGNPILQAVAKMDPYSGKVLLNAETAKSKGLKDDDMVVVENQLGVKVGPAPIKTTQLLHPKALGILSGHDRKGHGLNPVSKTGLSWNRLVRQDWDVIDPFTGAIEIGPLVRIIKTGS